MNLPRQGQLNPLTRLSGIVDTRFHLFRREVPEPDPLFLTTLFRIDHTDRQRSGRGDVVVIGVAGFDHQGETIVSIMTIDVAALGQKGINDHMRDSPVANLRINLGGEKVELTGIRDLLNRKKLACVVLIPR